VGVFGTVRSIVSATERAGIATLAEVILELPCADAGSAARSGVVFLAVASCVPVQASTDAATAANASVIF
jgi:hypothetical protein